MIWKLLEQCKKPYIRQNGEVFACGQCESCRRRQIQEWTVRGGHELITNNYKAVLLTLTYAPQNLIIGAKQKMNKEDKRGIFNCDDMTLFIKRFRKKYKHLGKLRYIYCAEYGTKYWRPHFHALFYNITWEDLEGSTNEEKKRHLKNLWKLGKVDTDARPISINAIQYVIGYARKKIGNKFGGRYIYEDNGRPRPCLRTSQGIGKEWNKINMENWLSANGMLIFKKGLMRVPRYYIKKLYESEGIKLHWKIKESLTKNGEKPKTRHFYKILKNPEGKKTKKWRNIQIQNFNKELKEIDNPKIKTYELKQKEIRDEYFIQDIIDWENTKKGTETKKYIREKIEKYHWKKRQQKKLFEEPDEKLIFNKFNLKKEFEEQRRKAIHYCEEIANRQIYGRRDKFELSLEFEGQINKKNYKEYNYNLERTQNLKIFKESLDKIQYQKVYRLIGEEKEFAGYTIPEYTSTQKEIVEYV